MKQLVIVVKPFRAEAVLKAAAAGGVSACVVREAKGYGRQKGYLERYVGSEYSLAFLPKVEIAALTLNPSAPDRIYAATSDGALFRSEDNGQHWQAVATVK